MIAADNLSVRLGGREILDDFSACFDQGRVTVIVGPNGAGKSTLLMCLAGLLRPRSGHARIGDESVFDLPHRERARRIGFLPQFSEIAWPIDVETLVGLGRTPHIGARGLAEQDRRMVEQALVVTGMTAFAGRAMTTLSGGERARALIARALAGDPQWLIADEPLTGLDPGHQLDAADIFKRFAAEGRGVLLTLHDLGFAARIADRVIVLADGRILADGAPVDALAPPILAEAYDVEARLVDGAAGPLIELLRRRRG